MSEPNNLLVVNYQPCQHVKTNKINNLVLDPEVIGRFVDSQKLAFLWLSWQCCHCHGALPRRGEDFRYDFSECHEGPPGAGPIREAFAYAVNCNPSAPNSSLLPQPLLDLPCEQPCESNHYLQVKERIGENSTNSRI